MVPRRRWRGAGHAAGGLEKEAEAEPQEAEEKLQQPVETLDESQYMSYRNHE
jgi:hypothetical protein